VVIDLEIKYTKGPVVRMLWLVICHECEITALYVVFRECDSFRGVPNCRFSLMNCVGLIESVNCYSSALLTSVLCAR